MQSNDSQETRNKIRESNFLRRALFQLYELQRGQSVFNILRLERSDFSPLLHMCTFNPGLRSALPKK